MTEELKAIIRDIPDFPKKGIIFKDITTLLGNADCFRKSIDILVDRYKNKQIELVVGIESRGFAVASALAYTLHAGLVLIRKPGKLPYKTISQKYELEYGFNEIQIHEDAIRPGQKVLLVDDLLATGGTVGAAVELVRRLKGEIVSCAFLIELTFLNGRDKLKKLDVYSIIQF